MPYAPYRDIAHFFPHLARAAAYGLAREAWDPWLAGYLEHTNVDESCLGDAAVVLAKLINTSTAAELEGVVPWLEGAGFFELPAPAQFALLAEIGQVVLGMFFMGIREATAINTRPALSEELVKVGQEVQTALAEHVAAR